ncbi:MAG: hypothetical protein H0T59_03535 [Chloroflexi bacterium]|nr:hypothetical protein [Chloroflexota bacterium]
MGKRGGSGGRALNTTVEETAALADWSALLLPEGTRLVHVGPHKTGTTSLQSAFHAKRVEASEHGVHYTGPTRQPVASVLAVTGRRNPTTGEPSAPRDWQALVREARRAKEPRVVISSEFFADAPPEAVATVVRDLDPVHIVVTLRPLARIIPSQWQQYVQSGMRVSFDAWLDAMLNKPDSKLTPTFWMRHRHDRLVARWAEAAGPGNVTVVALDDRDHSMVVRVFEGLTGLREGTLSADIDRTNRSMTMPEIEVVRAFNKLFRAEGLANPLHTKVMRFGAASYMKTRDPELGEPRIETPQWALDRAGEIAREMVDSIVASGVRIVGDIERMTVVPRSGLSGDRQPTITIPADIAAATTMGILISSGLARGTSKTLAPTADDETRAAPKPSVFQPRPTTEPLELVRVPTIQLAAVLLRRTRATFAERAHRALRRFR